MTEDNNAIIYVPASPDYADHPAGTAFAGKWDKANEDHLMLWYEEPDTFSNVVTFEDRLNHSAGRMRERYATSKIMHANQNEFIEVGVATYLPGTGWYMSEISNPDALTNWAGAVILGGSPDFHGRRQGIQYRQSMEKK